MSKFIASPYLNPLYVLILKKICDLRQCFKSFFVQFVIISVKTGHNLFPGSENLIFITIFKLNCLFLVFVTTVTTRFHNLF